MRKLFALPIIDIWENINTHVHGKFPFLSDHQCGVRRIPRRALAERFPWKDLVGEKRLRMVYDYNNRLK
jgi:hypothetical protein